MKKTVVILISAVLLITGAGAGVYAYSQSKQQVAPTKPVEQAKEVQKTKYEVGPPDATEILELVNSERAKVGAKPLELDPNLVKSAQWKVDDMATYDYYGHIKPGEKSLNGLEYLNTLDTKCSLVGENIITPLSTDTSQWAVDRWMGSKLGHREAILNKAYTKTGIAVGKASRGGNYLVVEHFCQP